MTAASPMIDHKEIRRWAETHGGRPACVEGTGKGEDPGILRIDFDEKDERLTPVSWDVWFEWFERNGLALLASADSRFNKLVARQS